MNTKQVDLIYFTNNDYRLPRVWYRDIYKEIRNRNINKEIRKRNDGIQTYIIEYISYSKIFLTKILIEFLYGNKKTTKRSNIKLCELPKIEKERGWNNQKMELLYKFIEEEFRNDINNALYNIEQKSLRHYYFIEPEINNHFSVETNKHFMLKKLAIELLKKYDSKYIETEYRISTKFVDVISIDKKIIIECGTNSKEKLNWLNRVKKEHNYRIFILDYNEQLIEL